MKALKLPCLGILLGTLLAGCFGNDNATVTSPDSTRISYSGSTDPATLTQTNSAILLGNAYQGGQTGNAMGSAKSLSDSGSEPRQPRTLALSQSLTQAIRHADINSLRTPSNAATVNNVSKQPPPGTCGGQMSYTGTEDDASRQFYATFTFDNYCEDDTTITGTVTASGQTDAILGFSTLSLSFDSLTISSLGDSFTASGFEIITPHTSSVDIKMDMLLKDNASKLVYQVQNFTLSIIDGTGHVTVSLNGRYYDPAYGYADITTPTFLQINTGDYWPSSGSLHAIGNISSATLTALSNTSYQLDVDTNDDGLVDTSTTGLWNAL